MTKQICVQPLGWLAQILNLMMVPIMYVVSGTFKESPQKTHRWNNTKLSREEISHLDESLMVSCQPVETAKRWWHKVPLFHLPIFGGWKRYVVVRPVAHNESWYAGWVAEDNTIGISRFKLRGPVRLLVGSSVVSFFAVNKWGDQVPIETIGGGSIGEGSPFAKLPLL